MIGMELFLAHLVGDYIVQNDWQANWKTAVCGSFDPVKDDKSKQYLWWRPLIACTVHCLLYTLAVFVFTWYWIPWWGLLLCFTIHWPVDRFRLARKWMENISGQHAFANGVFSPWSIIVVDNIFHLLTLYGIWVLAGGPRA